MLEADQLGPDAVTLQISKGWILHLSLKLNKSLRAYPVNVMAKVFDFRSSVWVRDQIRMYWIKTADGF